MSITSPLLTSTPVVVASAQDVTKSFNGTKALDGVSLDISVGEAVGLLGPNGAGKSTLINLLSGLRRPDSGTLQLFGGEPLDARSRLRLGTTPQATSVPPTLKVRETVEFVAGHYPDPIPASELLADFGLTELAGKQCGGLSGGQQRRLLVALALVGRPDLVILDEPTTGLDIDARDILWRRLRKYRATGGTLLITSHYLDEIQALATRVVVINAGSVIADATVDEIRHRVSLSKVSFRSSAPASSFTALPDTVGTETNDAGRLTLITRDADSAVRHIVRSGIHFADLEVHQASLEEAFRSLTTPAQRGTTTEPRKAVS